jgi:hypothetical protein
MADQVQIYSGSGTLQDLKTTANGDEDVFRAKLIKLERVDDQKNTRATYKRVPFEEEYEKKDLFFFDTTGGTTAQPPNGTSEVLKDAPVYLNGKQSTVTAYRQN